MCESQLHSDITQTDHEIRTEKFITLASKSAAQGYEFSQNEDICASANSSRDDSSKEELFSDHQEETNKVSKTRTNSKNKRKHGRKERRKDKKAQYFQGHASGIANTPNGVSNYQYLLSEDAMYRQHANESSSIDKQMKG